MKTITVEKNRAFVYHELTDKSCHDIVESQERLRFDLIYKDDDVNLKTWRAVIKKSDDDQDIILELRDYEDNRRDTFVLDPNDSIVYVSALALRKVWDYIEENKEQFPPTQAFPKIQM